jgi:hypothetical protein
MKKIQLKSLLEKKTVKKPLKENEEFANYMVFEDLKSIHRMCEKLLALDPSKMDQMITDGHDWAEDHIAVAKAKLGDVTGFFMNHLGTDSSTALKS